MLEKTIVAIVFTGAVACARQPPANDPEGTSDLSTESSGDASTSSTSDEDSDADSSSDETSGGVVCGDAVVDPGEVCDDGINDGAYGGCAVDCGSLGPHCGDGRVQPPETCDGGAECNPVCTEPGAELFTIDDASQPRAIGVIAGEDGWLLCGRTGIALPVEFGGELGEAVDFGEDVFPRPVYRAIASTDGGDVVLAGVRDDRLWAQRNTSAGSLLWQFAHDEEGEALAIEQLVGGEIIVAGYVGPVGGFISGGDLFLAHVDASGIAWSRSFTTLDSASISGLAAADDGDVVAVGGDWRGRFGPSGSERWQDENGYEDVARIGETNAFAGVVAESIDAFAPGGTVGWSVSLPGDVADQRFVAVASDSAGNVIAVGALSDAGQGVASIAKLSPEGDVLWQRLAGDPTDRFGFNALAVGPDDAILAIGWRGTESDAQTLYAVAFAP